MDCDTAGYKQARHEEVSNEMKSMLVKVGWKKDMVGVLLSWMATDASCWARSSLARGKRKPAAPEARRSKRLTFDCHAGLCFSLWCRRFVFFFCFKGSVFGLSFAKVMGGNCGSLRYHRAGPGGREKCKRDTGLSS